MERNYSELCRLKTIDDRFNYLKLDGSIGIATFGFDRYLNQRFYNSQEWKAIRDAVILRDLACDLGIEGYDIVGNIYVHHMNPILPKDIERSSRFLLDPEYLICTTHTTHNAIHYGDENLLPRGLVTRRPNDTCPWKK
jgi:hypothetical protein